MRKKLTTVQVDPGAASRFSKAVRAKGKKVYAEASAALDVATEKLKGGSK